MSVHRLFLTVNVFSHKVNELIIYQPKYSKGVVECIYCVKIILEVCNMFLLYYMYYQSYAFVHIFIYYDSHNATI